MRVVLIIDDLSEHYSHPAIEFLKDTAHKRRWPQKPEAELRRMMEDGSLEADPDKLAAWVDKSAPANPGVLDSAIKHVEQQQLVQRTTRLNEQADLQHSAICRQRWVRSTLLAFKCAQSNAQSNVKSNAQSNAKSNAQSNAQSNAH